MQIARIVSIKIADCWSSQLRSQPNYTYIERLLELFSANTKMSPRPSYIHAEIDGSLVWNWRLQCHCWRTIWSCQKHDWRELADRIWCTQTIQSEQLKKFLWMIRWRCSLTRADDPFWLEGTRSGWRRPALVEYGSTVGCSKIYLPMKKERSIHKYRNGDLRYQHPTFWSTICGNFQLCHICTFIIAFAGIECGSESNFHCLFTVDHFAKTIFMLCYPSKLQLRNCCS